MAPTSGCVVGIDGLPLGTSAVVAIDGSVVGELELATDGGRPLDLELRVDEAIRHAGDLAGRPVGDVRLAVLDDGTTGERLNALGARLAAAGRHLRVVDLAVVQAASGGRLAGRAASAGRPSVDRARLAALAAGGDDGS